MSAVLLIWVFHVSPVDCTKIPEIGVCACVRTHVPVHAHMYVYYGLKPPLIYLGQYHHPLHSLHLAYWPSAVLHPKFLPVSLRKIHSTASSPLSKRMLSRNQFN